MAAQTLIVPDELPTWVPGRLTVASRGPGWNGVSVRGYRYAESDVGVPPMRDYMVVAYRRGATSMHRCLGGSWKHESLGPGDVSLLTRAAESTWRWPENIEVVHVYLTAHALSSVCADVYERDIERVELRDVLKAEDPAIYRTAMMIAAEAAGGGLGGRLYVEALSCQLAIQILRRHADVHFPDLRTNGRLTAQQVRTVSEFVQAHLHDKISLGDLAGTLSMSQYHFARQFREATGCSPHEFVIRRRLERAEHLLRTTTLSVCDIASLCGFTDQSHLTKVFRQRLESTPAAYRLDCRR